MRNGDYQPTRWEAQADAAGVVFFAKVNSNPENEVGVMTMAGSSPEVLVTRTKDIGQILSGLHDAKLEGNTNFSTAVNIAQLALKHRENKNQRQRILVFVGSPLSEATEQLVRLGKKLKKNNVSVDVVSLGEVEDNEPKLSAFVEAVNASDSSHYISIPSGTGSLVSDVLRSSPILAEEFGSGDTGGAAFGEADFGDDPELAMALRMSLEEEEARQRAAAQAPPTAAGELESVTEEAAAPPPQEGKSRGDGGEEDEETMLQKALALSQQQKEGEDAEMQEDGDEELDEDEAISKAIAMSMQNQEDPNKKA